MVGGKGKFTLRESKLNCMILFWEKLRLFISWVQSSVKSDAIINDVIKMYLGFIFNRKLTSLIWIYEYSSPKLLVHVYRTMPVFSWVFLCIFKTCSRVQTFSYKTNSEGTSWWLYIIIFEVLHSLNSRRE
jgi:hypothetical protein